MSAPRVGRDEDVLSRILIYPPPATFPLRYHKFVFEVRESVSVL